MRVVEELADNLAKDDIINETAKVLVATSSTMEEAYMTSIRVNFWLKDARAGSLRKRHKDPKRGSLCHLSQ